MSALPAPSSWSSTEISVSLVLRVTLALRISGLLKKGGLKERGAPIARCKPDRHLCRGLRGQDEAPRSEFPSLRELFKADNEQRSGARRPDLARHHHRD